MSTPDFVIDTNRMIDLDGVKMLVLADTREALLPGTRDISEEIPGRDGELDFGTEFEPRIIELHVAVPTAVGWLVPGNTTVHTKEHIKATIAKHFNPKDGIKILQWEGSPDRYYHVKYSGSIESYKEHPMWLEYTIPLKMPDPYIYSAAEHISSISGSTQLLNAGTVDTPVVVEVVGGTNPAITISSTAYGSQVMEWTGDLSGGTLVIDTDKMTVTLNSDNAVSGYNNNFPLLPPGESTVTQSGGTSVSVKWRDRWI